MVRLLRRHGVRTVVFDNLSTGHAESVADEHLIVGDLLEPADIDNALRGETFDAVMHFCALSIVGDSVVSPYEYYRNNVVGTLNLLRAIRSADIGKLVFSSTAAVYGIPQSPLIEEHHPTQPINPYGASKLFVERILADAARAYGLRSVSLRYFNAAGADPDGDIGESHTPETHLIPNILRCALGEGPALNIFGTDYPTPDGTCVRDYVHVGDLCRAHLLALDFMQEHDGAHAFNLGNGRGFSVLEVLESARRVTGSNIRHEVRDRRTGDPAVLVAANARAKAVLGWEPEYTDIDAIIASAWRWHRAPRY